MENVIAPKTNHCPSFLLKVFCYFCIMIYVFCYLFNPGFFVVALPLFERLEIFSMPKLAIYENDDVAFQKNDIRSARQLLAIQSEKYLIVYNLKKDVVSCKKVLKSCS